MSEMGWQNWAGNLHFEADKVVEQPIDLEALTHLVRQAAEHGRKIRVVGASCSWSPLVGDEELYDASRKSERDGLMLIGMGRMNRVLGNGVVDVSPAAPYIDVECGITIEELERELQNQSSGRRYTLISPTLYAKPTIGGVISVGAHGTDRDSGCFSDQVVQLTFVDHTGTARTVSAGEPGFDAARVCLGSFGVMYSARIMVQRDVSVFVDRRHVAFHRTFDQFVDLASSARYLEIFYWPLQSRLWLYVMNDTCSRPDEKTTCSRLSESFGTTLQNTLGGTILPWIASRHPGLTPVLCWASNRLIMKVDAAVKPASEAFHFQQAYPKAWDMSYAVPIDRTNEAWGHAIRLIDRYADSKLYPVNLVLHCRFTRAGDGWLAPNYGRDTCFIEVATCKGTPNPLWQEFFETLESHWFAIADARPHWAKLTNKIEDAAKQYPMMAPFLKERTRWDPNGRFLNPFMERLFGISPSASVPAGPWQPFQINLL